MSGTVYLSADLPLEAVERVVAHEVAHHSHVRYGIPCRTSECEAFANMFEELWIRMKRGRGHIHSCPSCGYPIVTAKCLRCGQLHIVTKRFKQGL
ncbi:MAG: hypothetical protein QXU69_04515 [Thermofilaceae archaeon]